MSETLRDLVVSLSLNSDNFTRNIKSINKQIQEAESAFRLASAGVENFETTTAGLSSKLSTLQRTFQLQQDAVGQYEPAPRRRISTIRIRWAKRIPRPSPRRQIWTPIRANTALPFRRSRSWKARTSR